MKRLLLFVLISVTACKKQYEDLFGSGKVEISSVVTHESVTIKNNSNKSVKIDGWTLADVYDYITTSTTTYAIPYANIAKGATITFSAGQLPFEPGIPYSHIYLYNSAGDLIDEH